MAKKTKKSTAQVAPPPLGSSPLPSSQTPSLGSVFSLPYHSKHDAPPPPVATNLRPTKQEQRDQNLKRNVGQEFDRYFGENTKLENWQRLCGDVGLDSNLASVKQCRLALKKVWVNIYDLLDAVKKGSCPPHRFASEAQLRNYTLREGKIFPKKKAKEGGPVKALLVHVF